MPSTYPEIKDKWDEVIKHSDRLAAELYYGEYLKIKNNPNLTPDDLQEIIE
jgi:hypothetical protein